MDRKHNSNSRPVAAPSSSPSSVAGVSSYYDDINSDFDTDLESAAAPPTPASAPSSSNFSSSMWSPIHNDFISNLPCDDIYSDFDTDLESAAAAPAPASAPSSSRSRLLEEASDDNDFVYGPSMWDFFSHEFWDDFSLPSICASQTTNSCGTTAGEIVPNLPGKDIGEEVERQSLLPSMGRDVQLELGNYKGECQSSQSNCPSKTTKPLQDALVTNSNKMIADKSISNLPEINGKDVPSSSSLSFCRDDILEPNNHKRKCQSYQSYSPSKTSKPVGSMLVPDSDKMVSGKSISNLPKNYINEQDALPATRASSSTAGQNTFFESGDSHVKLRIKSFTVPEFFVEIPESATWSFLKSTIIEKTTAIVGGGGHVGVDLQGKKIRDENKTLLETGISHERRLDVILEPKPSQALLSLYPHSCPLQLACDKPRPVTRYSPTPAVVHRGTSDTSPDSLLCNWGNFVRGDHVLVESQTNMLIGKSTTSMEVLAHPAVSVEALDVSPMHQNSNSSKKVQRRKRDFSLFLKLKH